RDRAGGLHRGAWRACVPRGLPAPQGGGRMITCEVFRRHVDTVIDGEVDPNTQIDFEQHLADCGPCRVHLAFARSFKRQLRDAVLESSPAARAELTERIKKALDVEEARQRAAAGGVPIGAAAAARPPLGLSGV